MPNPPHRAPWQVCSTENGKTPSGTSAWDPGDDAPGPGQGQGGEGHAVHLDAAAGDVRQLQQRQQQRGLAAARGGGPRWGHAGENNDVICVMCDPFVPFDSAILQR